MAIPLSNEIRALLEAPNFAHLATLMPDGSPQSVPIWVGREGDRILICTGETWSRGVLMATASTLTRFHLSTRGSRSPFAAPKGGWRS
jgi:nitroimidazol reductase NimA-like FMN-containing flavoprotein (pyridoxamine 5'-phosphate oxidase superfamily)